MLSSKLWKVQLWHSSQDLQGSSQGIAAYCAA